MQTNAPHPSTGQNPLVTPVLKWAGGKRQLLSEILRRIPSEMTTYYEPFLGGGAVLFRLQPDRAIVNDSNAELVNVYATIRDNPDELLQLLAAHRNEPDYFYAIRELDRSPAYASLTGAERASRILYLNKTCYNGLFRVNRQGQFNAPFGRYRNPTIATPEVIHAVSRFLRRRDIRILNGDFADSVKGARRGSFVYFDPPYMPVSASASFTGYTQGGFNRNDQERLRDLCDRLTRKGVKFLLSNSATPFVLDLYKAYHIEQVGASRAINANAKKRGEVPEVLVRNYQP